MASSAYLVGLQHVRRGSVAQISINGV